MATSVESLYESDYFAWAEAQARALRELEEARWNGPLDLEHLAEEVEDLARAERNAVLSRAERLIEHFLKLEYSASAEPRRQLIVSVDDARRELAKHLTPSLRRELDAVLPPFYQAERSAPPGSSRSTAKPTPPRPCPRPAPTEPTSCSTRTGSRAIVTASPPLCEGPTAGNGTADWRAGRRQPGTACGGSGPWRRRTAC